ncbi:MAG: hypothetical protein V1733_02710 [bacterium]
MFRVSLVFFFLACLGSGICQKDKQQLKIVFYNVENLFDTIDDKHKNDNEFLPDAETQWNTDKYFHKIGNIGRVLSAIDSLDQPAVIGLAEVENKQVLEDLIQYTPLSKSLYRIILKEGSDPRGIDVAMLYRKDKFTCLGYRAISASREPGTRVILYVRLLGPARDTLHLFVTHWKSRSGGEKKTRPKRMETAGILRHVTDSLFLLNPNTAILILGDLNDEPTDVSVAVGLGALPPVGRTESVKLYNLFYPLYQKEQGTIWFRDWDLFDQIIASGNLLVKKNSRMPVIPAPYGHIFIREWMLKKNADGEHIPFRTFQKGYRGGYSDHLPVYIILQYQGFRE